MRVKEWYGWHFPELAKIVQDNIAYAKAVKLMGFRVNAAKLDFSEVIVYCFCDHYTVSYGFSVHWLHFCNWFFFMILLLLINALYGQMGPFWWTQISFISVAGKVSWILFVIIQLRSYHVYYEAKVMPKMNHIFICQNISDIVRWGWDRIEGSSGYIYGNWD